MRKLTLAALTLLAFAVAAAPVVAQPADDPVPRILAAWKKREQAFKTVRYVIVGKVETFSMNLRPDARSKAPKFPIERPYRAEVLLDLPTGRFAQDHTSSYWDRDAGAFVEARGVVAFDGTQVMVGKHPDDRTPSQQGTKDVTILKGYLGRSQFSVDLWTVFHAHGVAPNSRQDLSPRQLKGHPPHGEFVYRGQSTISGTTVAVLRTEPLDSVPSLTDELFVDEKRDAAVLRHTYFVGKIPSYRIDIRWKAEREGWLPEGWTLTSFDGDKVTSKGTYQVDRIDLDPVVKDEDFRLPLRPGMSVYESSEPDPGTGLDPDRPAVREYVVTGLGAQDVKQETGPTTLDGKHLPPERNSAWLWWTLGVATLAAVAIAVTLLVRRGRTKQS